MKTCVTLQQYDTDRRRAYVVLKRILERDLKTGKLKEIDVPVGCIFQPKGLNTWFVDHEQGFQGSTERDALQHVVDRVLPKANLDQIVIQKEGPLNLTQAGATA